LIAITVAFLCVRKHARDSRSRDALMPMIKLRRRSSEMTRNAPCAMINFIGRSILIFIVSECWTALDLAFGRKSLGNFPWIH